MLATARLDGSYDNSRIKPVAHIKVDVQSIAGHLQYINKARFLAVKSTCQTFSRLLFNWPPLRIESDGVQTLKTSPQLDWTPPYVLWFSASATSSVPMVGSDFQYTPDGMLHSLLIPILED